VGVGVVPPLELEPVEGRKQPIWDSHGESPPSSEDEGSWAHGVGVPRQASAPPDVHWQPYWVLQVLSVVNAEQPAILPVHDETVQVHPYSSAHVSSVVLSAHGVTVPVHVPLDHVQRYVASQASSVRPEQDDGVPLQEIPPSSPELTEQPAARQYSAP
jgi:hypothetical protein